MKKSQRKVVVREGKKIRKWLISSMNFRDDLCMACAIASYLLYRALESQGFNLSFCIAYRKNGGAHAFLLNTETNEVIDITSTQFLVNGDPVQIVKLTDTTENWFHNPTHIFSMFPICKLKKHVKKRNWVDQQNPFEALRRVSLEQLTEVLPKAFIVQDLLY